ncbi:hypothetical protein DSM02_141 [Leeuwenhoekiella polynyae]|uniref:Uncharacterized protein n=1 Tax=Leeuwenhoekiella polynyae TaxID=1550906 RepID=A0A4Q0PGP5_9FLAO|nr:hypothetical protein DSM02_141 [Leeuwenhoekiella polynyae]
MHIALFSVITLLALNFYMNLTFDTYKPQYTEAFKLLNLHWLQRFLP